VEAPPALRPGANGSNGGPSKHAPEAAPASPDLAGLLASARIQLKNGSPLLPFDGLNPRASEQYKIARTKILQHFSRPRCLVVSSAQVEDGKSVSAINLAGCLALKDQTTVLLLDADMRRSRVADHLGVPSSPGLADVLAGQCTLDKAIVQLAPFPNLYFLPKGETPANPAELLDSTRWRGLSAVLRREFGFVIIDAPPIGLVTDYDLLQDVSDGVILVVRPDHTNRSLCLKALESIPPEKFIGVLVNCAREWFLTKPLGHRYDYYYDRTG
jgi:capsular exopolysaccharide synthesis family protein